MKPNRTTDDDGNVIGIDNAKKLLEMIPSKITDTMGIIADVNLFLGKILLSFWYNQRTK